MVLQSTMIKSLRSKGLSELLARGRTAKIDARMHRRISVILSALDLATVPEDMNVPGLSFHALQGFKPTRYTVHVNGPWCITFEFDEGDAYRVDYEQYH
jgi:toxin HigB-1